MTSIRPARDSDVALLPEIERSSGEIFRQWPGLEWIADDDVQSQEQHRALIAGGVAFVAELQGHGVVAFLNGEMAADALHVWQIAVHREQQGRGIGRELMEVAQQSATHHRVNGLTLTTFRQVPWNEPYYQRLGFITLNREEVTPWLKAVLDAEERAGLPASQRCAMRKSL
ncbi:GNAT family N-acetyltransferase [Afifella sp. JA880]|uniref:GNAT family N-acetyltransferase n=1 Tax=Afifella sp. JA880 TaxID=2975280 RepID=UPI0021BB224D|nr:GNAT family N-acetyltransferase [Afifella sp. JA880]MCT8266852.1 GNAT family N-acetyltransferase [Afifella sp. JA880]